ncbi:hypothetical protein BALAC2494_01982 [Bifidobacterium animalis subsp. lactis CNCM I-2494]|uniref:Uncharacterized protein n=1 Tax=Bifidobacterium animalis subsp. lactis CNCM I-2494 TaxID=1042403 RepID=A0A806FKZ4_BIFAN|nr:hypothetical protein BALAC2494_01982 [Bifidobacterium animalis subsp. lactis CNCM I-2494]
MLGADGVPYCAVMFEKSAFCYGLQIVSAIFRGLCATCPSSAIEAHADRCSFA